MASFLQGLCGTPPHAGQFNQEPSSSTEVVLGHFFVFLPSAAELSSCLEVTAQAHPSWNAVLLAAGDETSADGVLEQRESTSMPGHGSPSVTAA